MVSKVNCNPPYNSLQTFFLNSSLHVVILFIILGLIFIFYISKKIHKTLYDQISNIVNNGFYNYVNSLNSDEQQQFNNIILQTDFGSLVRYYAGPAPETAVNNKWIIKSIIATIILLLLMTFIVIFVMKFRCGFNIYLGRIIVVNIIIFFFVGIIEGLFFIKIGRAHV